MRWLSLVLLGLSWAAAQVQVAATTPVLADLVREVGGGRVRVESVVPLGADPHAFDLRPSTALQVSRARLLFANGLGLEPYLPRLRALLPQGARVVELAPRMPAPICGLLGLKERGIHLHGDCDPHMWLDPRYGVGYAEAIAEELARLDPGGREVFRRNLDRLRQRVLEEDRRLEACLAGRHPRVVVQHLSLLYLARRYGLEVVGALRDHHGAELGVRGRVALLKEAELKGVDLVVAEPQLDPAPMRRLAEELGARLIVLYTDALDRRVPTYLDLLRWNRERLCEASAN
ncbi:metal ABC transporter substrate-binding protein [Thermus tengchongensis]|uniref:Zinc ABC transporter substrate-binding protein n=1 Tax=Thermus tengchongensis TaxID=1214928 RepID=A0A4Y9FDD4_9DEIN|nr:metal ABC transporter substrate-binding protein [Thermus tengchongensis]TFU26529.1 zinc ABC transporter substrate-binding protein [Thermus tengchongensis]